MTPRPVQRPPSPRITRCRAGGATQAAELQSPLAGCATLAGADSEWRNSARADGRCGPVAVGPLQSRPDCQSRTAGGCACEVQPGAARWVCSQPTAAGMPLWARTCSRHTRTAHRRNVWPKDVPASRPPVRRVLVCRVHGRRGPLSASPPRETVVLRERTAGTLDGRIMAGIGRWHAQRKRFSSIVLQEQKAGTLPAARAPSAWRRSGRSSLLPSGEGMLRKVASAAYFK
jgi:hypothetical protein